MSLDYSPYSCQEHRTCKHNRKDTNGSGGFRPRVFKAKGSLTRGGSYDKRDRTCHSKPPNRREGPDLCIGKISLSGHVTPYASQSNVEPYEAPFLKDTFLAVPWYTAEWRGDSSTVIHSNCQDINRSQSRGL